MSTWSIRLFTTTLPKIRDQNFFLVIQLRERNLKISSWELLRNQYPAEQGAFGLWPLEQLKGRCCLGFRFFPRVLVLVSVLNKFCSYISFRIQRNQLPRIDHENIYIYTWTRSIKRAPTRLSTKATLLANMIFIAWFRTDRKKIKKIKDQTPNRMVVHFSSDFYFMAKIIPII